MLFESLFVLGKKERKSWIDKGVGMDLALLFLKQNAYI